MSFTFSRVFTWSIATLTVTVLLIVWSDISSSFRNAIELTSYRWHPSAERAYAYGELHFSSLGGKAYDIDRAEYFFNEVLARDASHPYVFHELARVAFLRGDFNRAIAFINSQIATHGNVVPNSYYVRGLILGYMGRYSTAAKDYEIYLASDPTNWAALNDYAWVLLKAGQAQKALQVAEGGLTLFPENPWLLNSAAIAAYESGELEKARERIQYAAKVSNGLTELMWLHAYPGNDPRSAQSGVETLRKSIVDNMHTITSRRSR